MPRSTLDNLPGTDDAPYPMPIVQDPAELGPWRWIEIAPGIWMPPDGAIKVYYPPWAVRPMGGSGPGSDAATEAHALLARASQERGSFDNSFARAILATKEAARASQDRLRQIQSEVQAGVRAAQAAMDTPAGRQQMLDFLQGKAAEAREVVAAAEDSSSRAAVSMSAAGQGYGSIAL